MVNSRHRICGADGCAANATFRAPGDKHPTLCGAHRTEGMVQARGVYTFAEGFKYSSGLS